MEVEVDREVLDVATVRSWADAASSACRDARERIDAVNVFPVPDADTGSNAALTLAGGAQAVAGCPEPSDAPSLVGTFAQGAALAARGNSGIILSQWLGGFATGMADARASGPGGAAGLALALAVAATAARAAVPDPQEGTVLTAARELAARAHERVVAAPGALPVDVLSSAADAVRSDLARLSAGHAVLRAAHVVDAGACALLVVVDALVHALRPREAERTVDLGWLPSARPAAASGCPSASGGAFEVMMLVRPAAEGTDTLVADLRAVGDAVAVATVDGVRHVHVHCDEPARAIDLVPAEQRDQVVVRRVDAPEPAARGLVVLTASAGLAAWYATCGAVTLVGSGATSGQLARAVADARAEQALVVAAGVAPPPGDPSGEPGGPTEVLRTPGDGPAVVACLAHVAAAGTGPQAATAALERLRGRTADDAAAVPDVVAALLQDAPRAQGVTLVYGVGVDDATAHRVRDLVEAGHAGLGVVVVGPADGPAWWVGVD